MHFFYNYLWKQDAIYIKASSEVLPKKFPKSKNSLKVYMHATTGYVTDSQSSALRGMLDAIIHVISVVHDLEHLSH